MISRRLAITGGFAVAGCLTLPRQSDGISADEYEIFGLQWDAYECIAGEVVNFVDTDTWRFPDPTYSEDKKAAQLSRYREWITYASKKHGAEISFETIDNFFAANRLSYRIDHPGYDEACVKFVSNAEAQDFSERQLEAERTYGDRRRVIVESHLAGKPISPPPYEFYDRRLRSFSRLGFSEDRTQGVGFKSYFCGRLCAGIHVYLAERRLGQWVLGWEELAEIS